jgi:hypothetical protein
VAVERERTRGGVSGKLIRETSQTNSTWGVVAHEYYLHEETLLSSNRAPPKEAAAAAAAKARRARGYILVKKQFG